MEKPESHRAKRLLAEDADDDLCMFGIVTNAETWIFVQLDPSGAVFSKSVVFPTGIGGDRPADERERMINDIFLTVHWLLDTQRGRVERSKGKYAKIDDCASDAAEVDDDDDE